MSKYAAGDRVVTADGCVGVVVGLAQMQTHNEPLYRVRFEDFVGLKDVTLKVVESRLTHSQGSDA